MLKPAKTKLFQSIVTASPDVPPDQSYRGFMSATDSWECDFPDFNKPKNYGMVVVDFAAGNVLYGEELWIYPDKSWNGLLRDWDGGLSSIPLDHYRVLKTIILKKVAIGSKIFFRIC